jgi:hypothetical protein
LPTDDKGRRIPARYLAGLPAGLQRRRVRELTASRDAYARGSYAELPTDRDARRLGLVRPSGYTRTARTRGIEWRGDAADMARRAVDYYGAPLASVGALVSALKRVYAKGLAAWKSGGHRPGASAHSWAAARVNSFIVGGKTTYTADQRDFDSLSSALRASILYHRERP